jgi:hypothetical protein
VKITLLRVMDNEGSDDSEERRAKKRITPDAKYQFLGDEYGFLRLSPKKRAIKNKMRNNLQNKWVMSMKRHWKTQKQNACMAAITIKRCDLSKMGYLDKMYDKHSLFFFYGFM